MRPGPPRLRVVLGPSSADRCTPGDVEKGLRFAPVRVATLAAPGYLVASDGSVVFEVAKRAAAPPGVRTTVRWGTWSSRGLGSEDPGAGAAGGRNREPWCAGTGRGPQVFWKGCAAEAGRRGLARGDRCAAQPALPPAAAPAQEEGVLKTARGGWCSVPVTRTKWVAELASAGYRFFRAGDSVVRDLREKPVCDVRRFFSPACTQNHSVPLRCPHHTNKPPGFLKVLLPMHSTPPFLLRPRARAPV